DSHEARQANAPATARRLYCQESGDASEAKRAGPRDQENHQKVGKAYRGECADHYRYRCCTTGSARADAPNNACPRGGRAATHRLYLQPEEKDPLAKALEEVVNALLRCPPFSRERRTCFL